MEALQLHRAGNKQNINFQNCSNITAKLTVINAVFFKALPVLLQRIWSPAPLSEAADEG